MEEKSGLNLRGEIWGQNFVFHSLLARIEIIFENLNLVLILSDSFFMRNF